MKQNHPLSRIAFSSLLLLILTQTVPAVEQAYPKTPVGDIELKTLPAATLIVSRSDKPYFEEKNGLFRPLFRYIQDRDIAMTTPVETEMDPGEMLFYIGEESEGKNLDETGDVTVRKLPERTVASIGVRGGYSASNFNEAKTALEKWLTGQDRWKPTGEAKGVFWDGPFTLWFLKRFEVHIPVEPVSE